VITAAPGNLVGNPFCTRHVRPGRLPSFDAAGRLIDLACMQNRLGTLAGSAAIVGPHGSGKTTLLGHLADLLEAQGETVARMRVGRARDAVMLLAAVATARRGDIICVDSWERLGAPWALVIRRCASAAQVRLLVTAHHAGELPTLWECSTTPALLGAIVARLPVGGSGPRLIHDSDMRTAFHAASGNIREALFLLYDTFEARARLRREGPA
jgi:hypothetical protein